MIVGKIGIDPLHLAIMAAPLSSTENPVTMPAGEAN
jgi:hypothetical protein